MKRNTKRLSLAAFTLPLFVCSAPSLADPPQPLPAFAIAGRETFDAFDVPTGTRPGAAILNKLQISATLRGDDFGLNGWLLHGQIYRFDGQSLSKRLGDIQTADNIESSPPHTRLFEAYLAKMWGTDKSSLAVRLGLIDLNSQFDSVDPASLMLNSSHGIGPDLSRSGPNGPSIYPVTAVGSTLTWVQSQTFTYRLGIYDGVAGNPTRPAAFFDEKLSPNDGLLVIGQVDWQMTKNSRLEGGVWGYTAAQNGPLEKAHDHGAYVSYEAPLDVIPHLNFWLRAGLANGDAQPIAAYLGAGLVDQGLLPGRKDDRIGIAIAHAIIGDPAVEAFGIHHSETSFEVTYQVKASSRFVIQPDLDYIHHPAGVARAPDSLGVGLRFVYATAYPIRMAASDPGDPTIPPDGAPSTSQ